MAHIVRLARNAQKRNPFSLGTTRKEQERGELEKIKGSERESWEGVN